MSLDQGSKVIYNGESAVSKHVLKHDVERVVYLLHVLVLLFQNIFKLTLSLVVLNWSESVSYYLTKHKRCKGDQFGNIISNHAALTWSVGFDVPSDDADGI